MIIGLGTDFWGNALFVNPTNSIIIDSEFIPHKVKLLPVIFSISGAIRAFMLYSNPKVWTIGFNFANLNSMIAPNSFIKVYTFLNRKWYFDKVYNEWINQPLITSGYVVTYKILDRGLIELIGPFGISKAFYSFSSRVVLIQTGLIYHYAFLMLMGLTFGLLFIGLNAFWINILDVRLIFIFIFSVIFVNFLSNSK